MQHMKTCRKCLKELPLSLFYQHKAMKDGFLNFCVDCVKSRVKVHRKANLEQIRKYDRVRGKTEERKQKAKEYANNHREKVAKIKSEWRKRNLIKSRAHLKVARAVCKGTLSKKCCEVCYEQKVEAHHPNYDEPLNVIWLCRKHHAELHAQIREDKRQETKSKESN